MPTKFTTEILTAAVTGFEEQKRQIELKIAEIRAVLDGSKTTAGTPEPPQRKRRKMSAAARARIAEGQRKRWASLRSGSEEPASDTAKAPKAKPRLSAAGRRAIIAATKRRWALKREEQAKAHRAATKKTAAKKAGPAKRTAKQAPKKAASAAVPVTPEASA